ncbi:hypothetical protein UR09_02710 [Candidatus Nitromaritima sp. SCGC AAA799-A02]|nr:hypothetical protein UR09_02710 [Candidatus Nitromaritima sp. SCGC AAA799-A02]
MPKSVNQSPGFFSKLFGGNGHSSKLLGTSSNLLACLNASQANLFFADTNFKLVHANDKSLETLMTIADDVKNMFGVPVDKIVGGSIHRFHKNPRNVSMILRH